MVHRVARVLLAWAAPCACLAVLALLLAWPRGFHAASDLLPVRPSPQALPLQRPAPGLLQLPFRLSPPTSGAGLEAVELLFSTSRFALRVANATATFAESPCRLEAAPGILWDKSALRLTPTGDSCSSLAENATVSGMLEVRLLDHGTMSLVVSEHGAEAGRLRTEDGRAALGVWRWRPAAAAAGPMARLQLLAAMWGGGDGVWVLGLLTVAAGAAGAGMWLWSRRQALACGLCALALAVTYAVIIPPFHAPDEPDHFLSWARQAHAPALAADAEQLARAGHFQRIKHQRYETFGPSSLDAPYPIPWITLDEDGVEQVTDSRMESRSALTTALWTAVRPLVSRTSAAQAVLQLRLVNALCFGLFVWIGAALLQCLAPGRARPWFIFYVPTLPFFAMHISNYALFASGGTLLACVGLGMLLRNQESDADGAGAAGLQGAALGVCATLLVLSASTGVAAGVFVLAMAAASAPGRWSRPAVTAGFWAGLLLGCLLLLLGTGTEQLDLLHRVAGRLMRLEGPAPWWTPLVVAPACCGVGALLEWSAGRLSGKSGKSGGTGGTGAGRLASLGRLGALLVAFGMGIVCIYSGFQKYAPVQQGGLEQGMGGMLGDLACALPSLLSFRAPDVLLSCTYWVGFGWHDAMLTERLVQLLAGVAGLGLTMLAWSATRQGRCLLGWRFCCWLAGCWGCFLMTGLAAVAAGTERSLPNIHGRYLLAAYAFVLAGAFAGWSTTVGTWTRPVGREAHGPAGRRFLEGWVLTGATLTAVLAVTRFSLPHVFAWLPVDAVHLAMAVAFPVVGWWWLHQDEGMSPSTAAAGLSLPRLLAGGALLGAGFVYAELGYGLPWVFMRYPYGFFVVLSLGGLWWLGASLGLLDSGRVDRPMPSATPKSHECAATMPCPTVRWSGRVACLGAVALHLTVMIFLLHRYLG